MPRERRTFRLFVSSTFADLKAERNALQEHVFPQIRRLALLSDCRFQDIDLRWGVSDEAALDQRTMRICLQEVRNCQDATPRPNFVVLLGDRYGWCPLPSEIPADEFALFRDAAGADSLLADWYARDDNAVPPVFYLKPRRRGTIFEDYDTWSREVERPLRGIIRAGLASLPADRRTFYDASATEHEIRRGALVQDAREHVFCFFRSISGLPETGASEYRDLGDDGRQDPEAAARLARLKDELEQQLGPNVRRYSASWQDRRVTGPPDRACQVLLDRLLPRLTSGDGAVDWAELDALKASWLSDLPDESSAADPAAGITLDHLPGFCADVFLRLSRVILGEIASQRARDPLDEETSAHADFGRSRSRHFAGRRAGLDAIDRYLSGPARTPLVVAGESGSGKTAFLAHAADRTAARRASAEVITRFIGATPESADGRSLLDGIWRDIARRYGLPDDTATRTYRDLARGFPERLAVATAERPLVVVLDALDQLAPTDRANALGWLPRVLPPDVYLVASTTPGEGTAAVERRLGAQAIIPLDDLGIREGLRLLETWLAEAGRRLTRSQRRKILEGFRGCRLPLYLKLAFEAAREWTSDDKDARIGPDIPSLIDALFGRLADEGNHGGDMVARSLAYLAASRHGLTEDELVLLLSRDHDVMAAFRRRSPKSPPVGRLPVVVWSRLFHDLKAYLARQHADGTTVLTFYHQQVRHAAVASFLNASERAARHAHLAAYYEDDGRLAVEGATGERAYNLRKLVEQSYQQVHAARWNEAAATLSDLEFLQARVESGGGFDAVADFDRAATALPASRFGDDANADARALVREFGSAFNQEADAFLARPATTAQQLHNNVVAHSGVQGAAGAALSRYRSPVPWLRRLNSGPRTAIPRSLVRTIAAHDGPVVAVASSPDGEWIASAGQDGIVRVFRCADGSEAAMLQPKSSAIAGLAWVGEGSAVRLVSAAQDGALVQWDWEAERPELEFGAKGPRVRCAEAVGATRIATGADDFQVRIWEAGAARPARMVRHQDRVLAIAASSSGVILSGGADRTVRLWRLDDAGPPAVLRGHERTVRALAIGADDVWGVSGDESGALRFWDLAGKREQRVVAAHAHWITSVGALAKSGLAVSGSADRTVRTWDAGSGQRMATLRAHTRSVTCLTTDPAERWFASGGEDGTVRVWRVEADRVREPDAEEHEGPVTALAELPDGGMASASEDQTIRLWDRDGRATGVLRGHMGPVNCVQVRDGRVVSGSADHTVREWHLDGSRKVGMMGTPLAGLAQAARATELIGSAPSPAAHSRSVNCLTLTDDGRVLSAGDDGTVRLWDGDAGRQLQLYEPVVGALSAMVVQGSRVFAAGTARELLCWRRSDGRIERRLAGHWSSITCLVGLGAERLVSGGLDGDVRLWDATRGDSTPFRGHEGRVNCLVSDPEGRHFASGGDDGRVIVWRADGDAPVEGPRHVGPVRVLVLDHSGKRIASAGDDGWVSVWDMERSTLLASANVGSAISAMRFSGPSRLWVGTRGASVMLLQLEPADRR